MPAFLPEDLALKGTPAPDTQGSSPPPWPPTPQDGLGAPQTLWTAHPSPVSTEPLQGCVGDTADPAPKDRHVISQGHSTAQGTGQRWAVR